MIYLSNINKLNQSVAGSVLPNLINKNFGFIPQIY